MSVEANFDGLVGPTHNYSGLSYGNLPSIENQQGISNPKAAALQGLDKMWFLASLGVTQGIILPHERPHLPTLRGLGFEGKDVEILQKVSKSNFDLLMAVSSAAAMWTANAATISSSLDSTDNHLHITPANLCSKFHRSIETEMTTKILKTIFPDSLYFTHHPPLPSSSYFADEGAANQMRFCAQHGQIAVSVFIFGRHGFKPNVYLPKQFPARQASEASQAISRVHQLHPERVLFLQQNPRAIDAGAFHNDVIAVSNCHVLLYHEMAFVESSIAIDQIKQTVEDHCGLDLILIEVKDQVVPLKEAVSSYLFNSQLVLLPDNSMALIAPTECQTNAFARKYLTELQTDPRNPISQIHYLPVRESMQNGGGPACLRLRVVLNDNELAAVDQRFLLTEKLYLKLKDWISKHYRDRLTPHDLYDPHFFKETQETLEALTKILELGSFYEFQKK